MVTRTDNARAAEVGHEHPEVYDGIEEFDIANRFRRKADPKKANASFEGSHQSDFEVVKPVTPLLFHQRLRNFRTGCCIRRASSCFQTTFREKITLREIASHLSLSGHGFPILIGLIDKYFFSLLLLKKTLFHPPSIQIDCQIIRSGSFRINSHLTNCQILSHGFFKC